MFSSRVSMLPEYGSCSVALMLIRSTLSIGQGRCHRNPGCVSSWNAPNRNTTPRCASSTTYTPVSAQIGGNEDGRACEETRAQRLIAGAAAATAASATEHTREPALQVAHYGVQVHGTFALIGAPRILLFAVVPSHRHSRFASNIFGRETLLVA